MKIESHRPTLPSAKVAPVFTGSLSLGAKPPLQDLQHRDLFFSNGSVRAKINDFVTQPATGQPLIFNFTPNPGTLPQGSPPPNVALVVNKIDPATEESPVAASTPGAVATQEPYQPGRATYRIQKVAYQPIENKSLFLHALHLKFPEDATAGPLPQKTVGFVPKTGDVIPQEGFEAAGIREIVRPGLEKLMGWLQDKLPKSLPGIRFEENGSVTLANRWNLDVARTWRNTVGHSVKVLNLTRLPNGAVVEMKHPLEEQVVNAEQTLSPKALKEALLQEIENVEAQGLGLLAEPVTMKDPQREKFVTKPTAFPGLAQQSVNPFAVAPPSPGFRLEP